MRPYVDSEIPAAMQRIADSEYLPLLASYVFPGMDLEQVRGFIRSLHTIDDFQLKVMYTVNRKIIENSITSFTYSGVENIDPQRKYLFVSNHRDIMLDASLMENILADHGIETSEISFGANLMQGQLVIDIGKSNKMYKVERPGGGMREFYLASLKLSQYLHHTINEKGQSAWIAQRNGRTKDGLDRTDQGIIKMFGMSNSKDLVSAIDQLSILPVSVSYEWEPCDFMKAVELCIKEHGTYTKQPGEDLQSILSGIQQPKGHVHFHFCKPLSRAELEQFDAGQANEFNRSVANLIDSRICPAYCLSPNNYIAHDMLHCSSRHSGEYSTEQKAAFERHIGSFDPAQKGCDPVRFREILLGIYANPVDSKELFKGTDVSY